MGVLSPFIDDLLSAHYIQVSLPALCQVGDLCAHFADEENEGLLQFGFCCCDKHSISSYKSQSIIEGSRGKNSRQELQAKATEECCSLAYSSRLTQQLSYTSQAPCLGTALPPVGWAL